MKTISEFINELNESVKPLHNTRVDDFGTLHSKVKELISPVLPVYFNANTWRVEYINKEGNFDDVLHKSEILTYNIDFTEDKRCSKYNRKGKLNKLWFEPINEVVDITLPLNNYLNELRESIMRNKISTYEKYIIETRQEAEKSIQSYEASITKLETELRQLFTDKILP